SIRHIRRPEPYQTSFHSPSPNQLSLATILMQQQTEKDEIREAATAKHNLQDIQQEQEFQAWWDKESRRIQGLPEPGRPVQDENERNGQSGRGGRGKGQGQGQGRKRRGCGKGGNAPGGASQQTPRNNSPDHTQKNSTPQRDQKHRTFSGNHTTDTGEGNNARRGGRGGGRGRGKVSERVHKASSTHLKSSIL
ncbi:hypothetical protein BBP40_001097, partial [Aspergillus hancockii]